MIVLELHHIALTLRSHSLKQGEGNFIEAILDKWNAALVSAAHAIVRDGENVVSQQWFTDCCLVGYNMMRTCDALCCACSASPSLACCDFRRTQSLI